MRKNLLLTVAFPAFAPFAIMTAHAQRAGAAPEGPPPAIAARTANMTNMPGLLPLHWDVATGKLYLEIPLDAKGKSQDLLYTNSLPWGTGSNDLGLDRGQTARGEIVHFERVGPKVLLIEPNEAFRSSSPDPHQQLSLHQSFPSSVLAGFTVAAQSPDAVMVDATDFFLRDVHGVADTLGRLGQGTFRVDATRSAFDLDSTKVFPKNTEVDAMLTFVNEGGAAGGRGGAAGGGGGGRGGSFVAEVSPDPRAMTVHEHQSFLELPGPGFTPRRFDPRAGYSPTSYRDYDTALGNDVDQQFIPRHRLVKKDPTCMRSCEAVTPIQYYIDNGAPLEIRTALLEGARWWDQAFQAAGWAPGTFKADILPDGADPMDVRYNMIQWVHRYTRGWSYGAHIADPRTGEIIKGNVTLGSLRGRQDYMIAEALLSPYVTGRTITPANDPMLHMVLQRLRQLAAHETGHTLGLAHNFAASTFPHSPDETMSVMEYPHPYITMGKDGIPDLSHAYPVNIGLWDKVAIDYGYRQFPPNADEHAELNKILADSEKTGMVFMTDEDARPLGSASPIDHLWDNGTDPANELNRLLDIRTAALARFGENAIKPGEPLAKLEDVLVPLYLLHRYQTEATIKMIGGLDYRYSLRGDGQKLPEIVPLADQNRAIEAVLKTLTPQVLTLSEPLLKILPPRPPGLRKTAESFPAETGLTFDPIATAEAAADSTLQGLLDPSRASRIVQYHMREHPGPSLRVLMESISKTTAERPEGGHTMSSEVERAVEFRGLEWMLGLAVNPQTSSQVRAIALYHIDDLLKQWTTTPPPTDSAENIHRLALIARIQEFKKDPTKFIPAKPIEAPPGAPIGENDDDGIY